MQREYTQRKLCDCENRVKRLVRTMLLSAGWNMAVGGAPNLPLHRICLSITSIKQLIGSAEFGSKHSAETGPIIAWTQKTQHKVWGINVRRKFCLCEHASDTKFNLSLC